MVNQVLENAGWKVIRFWSKSMRKDINACVETIMHILLEEKDKKFNMKQLKQKQL
ncbi:very short patch repair endonuclease [Bacteroides ovatus]|nr:very short patch repair endonuclease [Bacteroides ovatus]